MRRRGPGGPGGYGRLEEEGEDGFKYDAYISVCDADRDWVEQVNGKLIKILRARLNCAIRDYDLFLLTLHWAA